MSILVGGAHSEEPELGWAGPLHSGVASLKKKSFFTLVVKGYFRGLFGALSLNVLNI